MDKLLENITLYIKRAKRIERFTTMPKYVNTVSCINYRIDNIRLEIPCNGCTSFAVFIDEVPVGRIEEELISSILHDRQKQIKNELIESLITRQQ